MLKGLRKIREEAGLTRKQFGQIFGLSERQIASYESGETDPRLEEVERIAAYFSVSLDELFGRESAYEPPKPAAPLELSRLGERIRQQRERQGLSAKDMKERTGISPAYLSAIENGQRTPKLDTLVSILNALSMSADAALMDSIEGAQGEKATYLHHLLSTLPPSLRLAALRNMELFIKTFQE